MNAATISPSTVAPRTLAIDGMKGETCVAKVSSALRGVAGVTTQSVKVGSAAITSDKPCCGHACAAIDQAGYKARENTGAAGDSTSGDDQSDYSKNANDAASSDKSPSKKWDGSKSDGSKTEMKKPGQNESPTNNRDSNTPDQNKSGANKGNGPIPTPTNAPGMNKPVAAKQ